MKPTTRSRRFLSSAMPFPVCCSHGALRLLFFLATGLGEYTAACVAGVMSLEDALPLVIERARLMQSMDRSGAMHAILAPEQQVTDLMAAHGGEAVIAAFNGPEHVVISGVRQQVEKISSHFRGKGFLVRPLQVSHAFHSPMIRPMLDAYGTVLSRIDFKAPRSIRLVSNLTGTIASAKEITKPKYWLNHTREAVRFSDSIKTVVNNGCRLFIEIGPHPVLSGMGRRCTGETEIKWLPSLSRGQNDWQCLLGSLAGLYHDGMDIDWASYFKPLNGHRISLPAYPFKKQRFWFSPSGAAPTQLPTMPARGPAALSHPLATERNDTAEGRIYFRARLEGLDTAFFNEHRVSGIGSVPIAAVLEAAFFIAGRVCEEKTGVQVRDVTMDRMIALPEDTVMELEWSIEPVKNDRYRFSLFSREADTSAWQQNAAGFFSSGHPAVPRDTGSTLAQIQERCKETIRADDFYTVLETSGLDFGPAFHTIETLRVGRGETLGRLCEDSRSDAAASGYNVSPLHIDGALQSIAGTYADFKQPGQPLELYLPVGVDRFVISADPGAGRWGYAVLSTAHTPGAKTLHGDVFLLDDQARQVAQLKGCRFLAVDHQNVAAFRALSAPSLLYQVQWVRDASVRCLQPSVLNRIAAEVDGVVEETARRHDLAAYETHAVEMDRLVRSYIQSAFLELGWTAVKGELIEPSALCDHLGIHDRYRKLVAHYLTLLALDGVLVSHGNEWRVEKILEPVNPIALGARIAAQQPPTAIEVDLINRCGAELARILKGSVDPLDLLFSSDTYPMVVKLYRESTTARFYNDLVRDYLSRLFRGPSGTKALRVLEIGGGTGGTTQAVLDALEGRDIDYVFTDVSQGFVNAAGKRFTQRGDFSAQLFDLEKPADEQGLGGKSFDLIIAANVVHATVDLTQTLERIHGMTAPGGVVLLVEVTAPQHWIDLTFALTEGWWIFTDHHIRSGYPLVTAEQWKQLLWDAGFEGCAATPDPRAYPPDAVPALESLVVARRPMEMRAGQHCFVFTDPAGIGKQLADKLSDKGVGTTLLWNKANSTASSESHGHATGDAKEDFAALFNGRVGKTDALPTQIVYLWEFSHTAANLQSTDPMEAQRRIITPLLHLFQTLGDLDAEKPPRVAVVTRAAQSDGGDGRIDPHSASIWGLVRSVMLEHPEFNCKLVDLPPDSAVDEADSLLTELLVEDNENQVLIRDGKRRLARLVSIEEKELVRASSGVQRLDIRERGLLDHLYWKEMPPCRPEPGQVRIQVRATGLNFRDVLNALGVYADGPVPFGGECAGVVTEVGPNVEAFTIGDRVMAIAAHSFSSEIAVDARLTRKIPPAIEFTEAAALPVAYTTAAYALDVLAELADGQSILIHAGAGGVGMAAIHIALSRGAVVYTTAGSPEKRAFLEAKGVRAVMDSRSLAFADEIRQATGGRGVDVVLNSLSGDYIEKSLSVTAHGGTFLELGRNDIWTADAVHAKRPDIHYHAINLTEAMSSKTEIVEPILEKIVDSIEAGTLALLPCRHFDQSEVVEAFRFMAAARHIGKIVVRWPRKKQNSQVREVGIQDNGTYWITGGMGGLGLITARWLAEKGAGHIVLTGRHAPATAAIEAIDAIQRLGTRVTAMQSDAGSRADIDAVLAAIDADTSPLRGVVHAAGALDDGVVRSQTWQRFAHVFHAKVAGVWHLHQAVKDRDLDFFVLYSSAAGLLGSSGQANHAAANAFMDALAHGRQQTGLEGISINWGAWSDAGAAASKQVTARAALKGLKQFDPQTGLRYLEILMGAQPPQAAVMQVDWAQYVRQAYPGGAAAPLVAELMDQRREDSQEAAPVHKAEPGTRQGLRQLLSQSPEQQRADILGEHLHAQTLRILGLDETQRIDFDKPLVELGLDSLMAVEMRNALNNAMEQNLPATLLFDYPTIQSLCTFLLETLGMVTAVPPPDAAWNEEQESTDDLLRRIETMEDDEVDRLINKKDQNT